MDKNQITMVAFGAGIVGLFVGFAITSLGDGTRVDKNQRSENEIGTIESREQNDMTRESSGMVVESNRIESEREFITEMIPHHEEAIVSAREVTARGGTTPEIRALAQNIVTSQEAEIASMKTMFKDWYSADYKPEGNYKPIMRDVRNLSRIELDKAFLSDMIIHHEMAILMSNDVTEYLVHNELKTLTTNIKTNQAAELEIMKILLASLN